MLSFARVRFRPLIQCFGILVGGVCCLLPSDAQATKPTTFYVVRHAERPDEGNTDRLTEAGHERARHLRDVLQSVPLAAIYTTDQQRTKQTAQPTADQQGLDHQEIPSTVGTIPLLKGWARSLRTKHEGENVLIVGHHPTVVPIVEGLSGLADVPPIVGNEYDNLWGVAMGDGPVEVRRSRYGILPEVKEVRFEDGEQEALKGSRDLSAVAVAGDVLVVASDERVSLSDGSDASVIQILARQSGMTYRVRSTIPLQMDKEADFEAMALVDRTLYVAGSHSRGRRKVDASADYAENRITLGRLQKKAARQVVYRLDLDTDTYSAAPRGEIDLREILASGDWSGREILEPFLELPSKENGLDAEGLAADGGWLYVGFRGPVLSGGVVPVLKLKFDSPHEPQLLFVTLAGQGIRSLERVGDGFLIIAGPVSDAPGAYHLYHWDGNDCVPGKRDASDASLGRVTMLGTIAVPARGKPEGLALLDETSHHYEFLVVYDGPPGGAPRVLRAGKP